MTDVRPGTVQVAYLYPNDYSVVSYSWHHSMMALLGWDGRHHSRILSTDGPLAISSGPLGIVEARNMAVSHFLDTPYEWLFFIDTDMGFHPDTVDRLVAAADPQERPVIGGLCFALREIGHDDFGGRRLAPVPTLFGLARDPEKDHIGFVPRMRYAENTLTQVAGTGTACLLIHRSALVAMREKFGHEWFDQVAYGDGKIISEDLSFCWRLSALGIPLFVHTGVRTTHHKQIWVGEQDYRQPESEPQYRAVNT